MGGLGSDSSKTSYSVEWSARRAGNSAGRRLGVARTHPGTPFLAAHPLGWRKEGSGVQRINLKAFGVRFMLPFPFSAFRKYPRRIEVPRILHVPRGTVIERPAKIRCTWNES